MKPSRMAASAAAVFTCTAGLAGAQTYELVADFETLTAGLEPQAEAGLKPVITGITADGGTIYTLVQDLGGSGARVTRGTPGGSFGVIVDDFDLLTETGRTIGFAAGASLGFADGELFFLDINNKVVYAVDGASGSISVAVSEAAILALTGESRVSPTGQALTGSGDVVWYDSLEDSILRATRGGALSVAIPESGLEAPGRGIAMVNAVAAVGETIYLASATTDSVWSADLSAADPAATLTEVLSKSDLATLLGTPVSSFSPNFRTGMIVGGDGRVYLTVDWRQVDPEENTRAIIDFDPAAPAATAEVVIDKASLVAGPSSDALTGLTWYDGRLAWWYQQDDTSGGFGGLYALVEEPECPADRDGDGDSDVQDLLAYLRAFRTGTADMDGDEDTDVQDLLAYLRAFRTGC